MTLKQIPYVIFKGCLFSVLLMLSACTSYQINETPQPNIRPPSSFSIDGMIDNQKASLQTPWWNSFEREGLSNLINQALSQNYTLAESVAVLKQAKAVARQTNSFRLPQLDARADSSVNWQDGDQQRGNLEAGVALSWEVDVWNRIGFATQADRLEVLARLEDVEALKLSLSAEVANAYFGAVAAHQRLDLLEEQLELDKNLLELLQLRLDSGVGTSVDVLQQKARVADSETLVPLAQSDLAVFENRIDVLIGQVPDSKNQISSSETLSFARDLPSISVPAALLLNRPDLRAAQAELIAADADIAAAIADRLPQITLNGAYAFSDNANYTGPVGILTGIFVAPLLDWGRRKAEVARNEALYEQRLASFTQLFLTAVEDVENALIREQKQREFLTKLQMQESILQRTVNASEERYTQGIDDYLPVINALQELRAVERNIITEQLNLINIRIELFRAIGAPTIANMSIDKGNIDENY